MINRKDIMDISSLSKLYLSEDEIQIAIKDVSSMVEFVSQINSVDFSFATQNLENEESNSLREDKIKDSFLRDEILKNAQGGKDGFFCVEKFKK